MLRLISLNTTATLLIALVALCRHQVLAHGDLHERIETLTRQITLHPDDAKLWLQRADLRRQHEEFDAALTDLERAGKVKPGWPLVPLQQARIYFDLRRFAKCERAATACLALDPVNADALVLRARSRVHLKKSEDAIADYNAVLTRTNSDRPLPDLFVERARAQAALGQFDEALRGLDEGLKQLGETPSFVLPAIEYERARGNFGAALVRLNSAKRFMSHEGYLAISGEILLQAGHRTEARDAFERALTSLEQLPSERRALPQTVELEKRLQAGRAKANVPPLP